MNTGLKNYETSVKARNSNENFGIDCSSYRFALFYHHPLNGQKII
jgi:hypothetical protein